jgi:hypothetical protein
MRTFLLATALAFAIASPALARQSAFTPTTVPRAA